MGFFAKLLSLFQAKNLLAQATSTVTVDGQPKPGIATSEFWSKNVIQLVLLYNALFAKGEHQLDPQVAAALVLALEAAYLAVRQLLKAFHAFVANYKATVPAVDASPK